VKLDLAGSVYGLTHRPLVVGILNRTRDSFFDRGAHFNLDPFVHHAEQLVDRGADVLDVGARPGGVGVREVSEEEETALVLEALDELRRRFDLPLSVDTQRATGAAAAFDAGAVLGKTWRQTITLLAHTPRFAQIGHPLLVAVSNKIFLGRLLGLEIDERATATAAACAYAVARGARVIRVHDMRAGRQVADLLTALLADESSETQ